MFQLTETAAKELKRIKDQLQERQPGSVPRLIRSGDEEFKLGIDVPASHDHELFCADEKVLIVDPETSGVLENVTLDYMETPRGHAFVFEQRTP